MWRSNERVSGADTNDTDNMKIDGAGSLGSATIVTKIEELPNTTGKPAPMGGAIPQTDKQGMKIMGESGAGATGRDIND